MAPPFPMCRRIIILKHACMAPAPMAPRRHPAPRAPAEINRRPLSLSLRYLFSGDQIGVGNQTGVGLGWVSWVVEEDGRRYCKQREEIPPARSRSSLIRRELKVQCLPLLNARARACYVRVRCAIVCPASLTIAVLFSSAAVQLGSVRRVAML